MIGRRRFLSMLGLAPVAVATAKMSTGDGRVRTPDVADTVPGGTYLVGERGPEIVVDMRRAVFTQTDFNRMVNEALMKSRRRGLDLSIDRVAPGQVGIVDEELGGAA